MGRSGRGGLEPSDDTAVRRPRSAFPLVVTGLCLGLALTVFFTATVPALQERRMLESVEVEKLRLRDELDHAIAGLRARDDALRHDVQTVLLEIDRLGLLPADLGASPGPRVPPDRVQAR